MKPDSNQPPKSDYASRKMHPPAYAWRLETGHLCYWAEPSSEQLQERSRPSPGATVARVRLVPIEDYQRMLAAWRRSQ